MEYVIWGIISHTQRRCNILEAIDYESLEDILIVFSGNKSNCRLKRCVKTNASITQEESRRTDLSEEKGCRLMQINVRRPLLSVTE